MEFTTSKLITLCYAIFAVVLGTLGYFFYQSQARSLSSLDVDLGADSEAVQAVPAPGSQAVSRRLKFEIDRQRQRINELQALLDKRENVLKLQASQLKNNTQEYRELQERADEYLDLLFDVIQGSALRVNNLALLEGRATQAEAAPGEEGNNSALETLQIALEASQWELEQSIQSATALEVTAAGAEQRNLLLQQAIIDLGEIAVPTLIGLLGDQSPVVRTWAATALGRLGANGTNAIDALSAATEDPDSEVRAAAANSIQEISASW